MLRLGNPCHEIARQTGLTTRRVVERWLNGPGKVLRDQPFPDGGRRFATLLTHIDEMFCAEPHMPNFIVKDSLRDARGTLVAITFAVELAIKSALWTANATDGPFSPVAVPFRAAFGTRPPVFATFDEALEITALLQPPKRPRRGP